MLDKTQIQQMIEGIKGSLAELESALGEGEAGVEAPTEESPDMEGGEMGMAKKMPPESAEGEEEMPPMLKKFVRG